MKTELRVHATITVDGAWMDTGSSFAIRSCVALNFAGIPKVMILCNCNISNVTKDYLSKLSGLRITTH
jgi:hypothetical protein